MGVTYHSTDNRWILWPIMAVLVVAGVLVLSSAIRQYSPEARARAEVIQQQTAEEAAYWQKWQEDGLPAVIEAEAEAQAQTVAAWHIALRASMWVGLAALSLLAGSVVVRRWNKSRLPAWERLPDAAVLTQYAVVDTRSQAQFWLGEPREPNLEYLASLADYKRLVAAGSILAQLANLGRGLTKGEGRAQLWARQQYVDLIPEEVV